jgi:hypothetical protein
MSSIATTKSTGLAKTGESVRYLAQRLERARQSRNEKVARADAEYVEAVRRALAAVSEIQTAAPVEQAVPERDGDMASA